jgi:L-ascorbate metabolism protein UlaG (beta-lactamase superfamily)
MRDSANMELVFDMAQLSLRDVLAIHQMMFDRLMVDEELFALELAELLEDAANRYLDLSEEISARYRWKKGLSAPTGLSNEQEVGG